MSDSEPDNYALSHDESDGYEPEVAKKSKAVPKKTAGATKPKASKSTAKIESNGAAVKKRKLKNDSDIDDDEDENDENAAPPPPPPKTQKKGSEYNETKTIEEIYQKKTPLEHILLRPDTYIGTTEMNQQSLWVLDPDSTKFVNRQVNIVPGLYKIVDEIIVNAADNKIRDPSMDTIKIDIDKEKGQISVYNNGKGIPVEIHKTEGCYVPELIFGHLLTSSNYDDSQKKVTGGRNGYGAKLCNIFSTEFIVETADKSKGLMYKQIFSKNMSVTGKPRITPMKKGEEFTRISFRPDFTRFSMECIDADLEALLKKRTYDMAGCVKGIKVFLNGERIKIKNFKEYIDMYIPVPGEGEEKPKMIYDSPNERWEIACIPSDGQFQHVSFVNSISTSKGGVHVDYIANQIVKELVATVKKKSKSTNVKPFHIKSHMWVFVNCLVENPAFDSQTKENMTLKQSAFGSKCELSEKFIKDIIKSPIVDGVVNWAAVKDSLALKKTDGSSNRQRLTNVPKLEDAHKAGRGGRQCTLILTEGDSAKTLVMAGFSVIGRDHFGVFPLRGKLLNVRDTATSAVSTNKEIGYIKQILGLKQGKVYTSIDELRYGHLMIMTDQDHDGSHIKGLVINFLDHYFPSLLKIPGFLVEFITPIVKATKGNRKLAFFTIPEYESWKESENGARGWKIKYYKGLGTSTNEDAKDYFSQMDRHKKEFAPSTDEARALVDMAFNKKKADERKEWLSNFQPGTYLDTGVGRIPIEDFINKELILFSMADNIRSIPSMVDGLKPGQRKVIFGAFKKKIVDDIKVAQLAGYVSEKSSYHHGEQSLTMTIVGLAQDFVGSNNVNLLSPKGQFGSRMQGGKDAASARYIFTSVPQITRRVFHAHDDPLLNYLNDDGDSIEPEWYLPVLPMVLVNGSEGIGTGWSSSVPNYNPVDIISNLRRLMKGEEQVPMLPWYRGFVGLIEKENEYKYKVSGTVEELDDSTVKVSELPIRTWTTPYKEQIESWISGTEKTPAWIKDYRDDGTLSKIDLTITLTQDQMRKARAEGLESKFKLVSSVSTSNMVCFDPHGRIKKYSTPEEIVQEFYDLRLTFYRKRKEYLVDVYTKQWQRIDNKVRFILMIISGELVVQNRKKALIVEDMVLKGFNSSAELDVEFDNGNDSPDPEELKVKIENGNIFDYLLKLPIWSMTFEKVEELKRERDIKNAELKLLIDKSAYDLWNEDLDAFTAAWEDLLQTDIEKANYMGSGGKGKKAAAGRGRALGGKSSTTLKRKAKEDDDFEDTKPKKALAVKKPVSAVKKEPSPPEIKTEKKHGPISDFFNKSASSSTSTGPSSSLAKKQQSILDMMKPKETNDTVKKESDESDNKPIKKEKSTSRSKGRSKYVISDVEDDEDDEDDFTPSKGKDDDDVEMEDFDIAPRELPTRAPRAARAKRPVILEESDFERDESDFIAAPKKSSKSSASRKTIASVDTNEGDEDKSPGSPAESSEDEGYQPTASSSRNDKDKGKGKATYKSRKRTTVIESGSDQDEEDSAEEMAEEQDDEEDDYVEAKVKKQSARPTPAVTKASKPARGRSTAAAAAKKMFSLSNDGDEDDEDVDMDDMSAPDTQEADRDDGSGSEDMDTSNASCLSSVEVPARRKIPPAIVDDDDDSMFSISAPSKVAQVKKRPTLTQKTSKSSGAGASGSSFGGESSKINTSSGALAGAKTLNSSSSKVMAATSQLLAELDDVPMIVNRASKPRSMSRKPKYVDISDDD
ncbi:DNA topoisomerase 2 [Mortierella polycephala]|uniref:DNA topoisomerase 2 n=1 Tax=Mortierella polycephala TaxID=41804 RepID=A0A9P6QFF8_9FUNG|nr:DNA topoisomerase 2 [Mortierella polycephala]